MNIFRLITQFINSYGIIRICTIDTDCESLENFEALMALGNLASLNESVRLVFRGNIRHLFRE